MRLKLTVRGAVQGVGFRPYVHRLASQLALRGWVSNSAQGVFIEVEGPRAALEAFFQRLEAERPPHSFIQSLESSWLDPVGYTEFTIRASDPGGDKTALVLPDIATCPDCLREVFDPANRRYRYPFTNCTHCGPRFSIITSLPYDRPRTTMAGFTMCPACRAEYENPQDRRFHAQPNACPACGPHLELWPGRATAEAGATSLAKTPPRSIARDHNALLAAAEAIRRGQIVAVKGLGGFHLMVDARNEAAVRRLRQRKHREEKPLALMFPSLASVRAWCEVSPLEARLLGSAEAPIVLLRRLAPEACSNRASELAPSLAPANPYLGVLLPYTPLHHLLLAELGFPVVATSGNLSDEPICTDEHEAFERLGDIADVFLVHNRPIARHVDDSVARIVLGRELLLRRARGYAPLPVRLGPACSATGDSPVLATGAHLKNTVALAVGSQAFLSQHIGDLDTAPAHAAFRGVIADFQRLYGVTPVCVAADLHPDYLSTRFAQSLCGTAATDAAANAAASPPRAAPPRLLQVQHHVAHVLGCMAENELAPPLLGVAWDGTGYGSDGTVWGGEFFRLTGGAVARVAHWRPFPLPGGDQAVREPRRSALGLLHTLQTEGSPLALHLQRKVAEAFSSEERAVLTGMLKRRVNSPLCSSVGRLFDAVAFLVGLRERVRYEGQAAMELEFALEGAATDAAYPVELVPATAGATRLRQVGTPAGSSNPTGPVVVDWVPLLEALAADVARGVAAGAISAKFHNALAEAIVLVARQVGESRVVLSGGCFQNRYLTERAVTRLRQAGFQAYWHQRVPPNDGGIALGQVVAARCGLGVEVTVSV